MGQSGMFYTSVFAGLLMAPLMVCALYLSFDYFNSRKSSIDHVEWKKVKNIGYLQLGSTHRFQVIEMYQYVYETDDVQTLYPA